MKNNKKYLIIDYIFTFLYTIILYSGTYFMRYEAPLVEIGEIRYLIVGYLIVFGFFLIIKSIIGNNLKTNITATILLLIITIISYYKVKTLVFVPFLPSDVLLIGNINQIAEFGITGLPIRTIMLIVILVLFLIVQYILRVDKYEKKRFNIKREIYRIPIFIVGISLIYILCISPNRFSRFNIKNDLLNSYQWMGGPATFFIHLGDFYYPKPSNYTEENLMQIKKESISEEDTVKKDNPNVIMIMNEAFTNPNSIENVEFSKNPIGDIEELNKIDSRCIIGNMISPVVGGSTSLPEFEALTGLSSYFIEKQIFPYTSYITQDINSIVRVYNNNGYTTTGMHTNTSTFYNRENVYKYLGFQQTIFSKDIERWEIKGDYISDNVIANEVIKEFKQNKNNKFIFAVTMQNHMPYDTQRYSMYDIQIDSDSLNKEEMSQLKDYIQGVYDANKLYIKLVNYLKNIKEPTILVMFGDHLPALAEYSIYQKSNYNTLDYYTVPYIVWTNYDVDYDEELFCEYMCTSNLAISVMRLANIEIPWYLKKIEDLYNVYPVINNQIVMNKENEIIDLETIENYDLVNDSRILLYDLLIKKKYIPIQ